MPLPTQDIIDLRSDTVTRPTPGMLEAMFHAQVGDDVYEEDPSVNALQEKAARMFGMEAGLFCPSGTMTNQIAIKLLTHPGDEVICDRLAHIYNYEGGGIAVNSLASVRLLEGERGRFTPEEVVENINSDNLHYPRTSLVALENTVNKGGGCYYTLDQIAAISKVCQANDLSLHLDGARVCNALVATGENSAEYSKYFDTISLCLSKGLGTPVGSVLLASRQHIEKAKRIRKVLGGGWRQAGFLAAAGIYALDHHIGRLAEDHQRAQVIARHLQELPFVKSILPVETNIVIFQTPSATINNELLDYLKDNNILAAAFGKDKIRFVTHLDFTDTMLARLLEVLKKAEIGLKKRVA
jgi:threonine aldolase